MAKKTKNTAKKEPLRKKKKFVISDNDSEPITYTVTYPKSLKLNSKKINSENTDISFEEENQLGKYVPILIVGTGLAGSLVASELEKRNFAYAALTDQINPEINNTNYSFANCRIPTKNNLSQIVKESDSKYGQDKEITKFVYQNSELVEKLFKELNITYKKTPFGIMPSDKYPGGREVLTKLQDRCNNIFTNTKVVEIRKIDGSSNGANYKVLYEREGKTNSILTRRLILAIGGTAGQNLETDNILYQNESIFQSVKNVGGEVIDTKTTFYHPFGYNFGKKILIGDEIIKGNFVDQHDRNVFSTELENKIKNNDYHESFPLILAEMEKIKSEGKKIIFKSTKLAVEVSPTAHYTLGGIVTDALGRVKGCPEMYAIGECRSDGMNCIGRLPGYPFTAAIVQGYKVAEELEFKAKIT